VRPSISRTDAVLGKIVENLDWPNRRRVDIDLASERLFHVPTPGDRDRPVGATGVFHRLAGSGELGAYTCYARHLGAEERPGTFDELLREVERFTPTIVLWQHPASQHVPEALLRSIKATSSRPVLGYDEKDPYGLIRKRLSQGGRALARQAHRVFLAGAGVLLYRFWLAGARNISYSPSEGDRSRFDGPEAAADQRRYDAVMIANRVQARRRLPLDPVPGVSKRARLAEALSEMLGERFAVAGEGWDHLPGAIGPVGFDEQGRVARDAWLSIGWDHYNLPYNFSNRLPITLLSGVAFLTNRQVGYDTLFRDGEHLFLVDSVARAVAAVQELLDGDRSRLLEVARTGRDWARRHYSSEVVYRRQLEELAHMRREMSRS
jgi:hypothetical protein